MNIIQGSFYLKSGNIISEKIEVGDINTAEAKDIIEKVQDMIDSFKLAKRTKRCGTIRFRKLIFDVEQIEAIYLSEQVVDE